MGGQFAFRTVAVVKILYGPELRVLLTRACRPSSGLTAWASFACFRDSSGARSIRHLSPTGFSLLGLSATEVTVTKGGGWWVASFEFWGSLLLNFHETIVCSNYFPNSAFPPTSQGANATMHGSKNPPRL